MKWAWVLSQAVQGAMVGLIVVMLWGQPQVMTSIGAVLLLHKLEGHK